MGVAYKMEELNLVHQQVVTRAFEKDAYLKKWDNTGRAQDPTGTFPPACIWRYVWDAWNRTQHSPVTRLKGFKGLPASLLYISGAQITEINEFFKYAPPNATFEHMVWNTSQPTLSQTITRTQWTNFISWKVKQQQEENAVSVIKGNKVARPDTGSALPAAPPTHSAPPCPKHGERMRYNAKTGSFVCPEPDCTYTATPKNKKDQLKDSVLKGEFELIHTGDDKYVIRHVPTGAIIDFGEMVQPIGTGELHGQDGEYAVLLQFSGRRDVTPEYDPEDDNG